MHEMEMKLEKLSMVKEELMSCFNKELACGISNENVQQLGLMADMIKDIAEAEKECAETFYYKDLIKVMKESQEGGENERYGYNNRHYMNGRFAPSGRGHVVGYHPGGEVYDPMMYEEEIMRMGYDNGGGGNRSQSGGNYGYSSGGRGSSGGSSGRGGNSGGNSGSSGYSSGSRYGYNYDRYDDARRNFSETKDPRFKEEMNQEAMYHMKSMKESIKDIWNSSDPEAKQKLKSELSSLINNDLK